MSSVAKHWLKISQTTVVVLFLFGFLARGSGKPLPLHQTGKQTDESRLAEILLKTGQYCERLKAVALHFICTEEVKEKIHNPYRFLGSKWKTRNRKHVTENNYYVYDYQLVRKEDPKESRILIQENGELLRQENAQLKTKRFNYNYIIFGPIGLLSPKSQKYYHFTILKKDKKLWGRPVDILEAIPRDKAESARLYGKIWVDQESGGALKIEWEDQSIKNYAELEKDAKRYKAKPKLSFVSEYKIEKNGIHFPSRYYVKELLIRYATYNFGSRMEWLEKSELSVIYKEYKFFIVETEVKHGTD